MWRGLGPPTSGPSTPATPNAPMAMVSLGALLAEQGNVQGARAAYQRAIDTGQPDQALAAMVNLGVLLAEQGDVEGARAAYQRAIDTGHPNAPMAMVSLGAAAGRAGQCSGGSGRLPAGHRHRPPRHAPMAMVAWGCCWPGRAMWRGRGPPSSGLSTPATPTRRRRRCAAWRCSQNRARGDCHSHAAPIQAAGSVRTQGF